MFGEGLVRSLEAAVARVNGDDAVQAVVVIGSGNVFSMGGLILCQALASAPFVFLLLTATLRAMDPALEEGSGTSGAASSGTGSLVPVAGFASSTVYDRSPGLTNFSRWRACCST